MRCLVTGGAGFVGSHLVAALTERGDEVTALDNLRRGSWENLDRHPTAAGAAARLTADIRDYSSVLSAADGVDLVFHLAAQSNVIGAVEDPDYSFTTNVVGTLNLLRAAAQTGARRVVFASSREVYGEAVSIPVSEATPPAPKNLYGASKVAGEAYCRAWRASGIECQVVRLTNVYGRGDRGRVVPLWLERAVAGEPLILYGGEQVLDFVSIRRAVAALLAAADCPEQEPINVGSGRGSRLLDLAQLLIKLTGSPSRVELRPARVDDVVRFVADVAKMRGALGVDPGTEPLDDLPELALQACAKVSGHSLRVETQSA